MPLPNFIDDVQDGASSIEQNLWDYFYVMFVGDVRRVLDYASFLHSDHL